MAKDNDLIFDLNLSPLFGKECACNYDTVVDIADDLVGLSELVKAKAREQKKDENISMMLFIANTLKDFSVKLYNSEFSCYVKKKSTPTTTQE